LSYCNIFVITTPQFSTIQKAKIHDFKCTHVHVDPPTKSWHSSKFNPLERGKQEAQAQANPRDAKQKAHIEVKKHTQQAITVTLKTLNCIQSVH